MAPKKWTVANRHAHSIRMKAAHAARKARIVEPVPIVQRADEAAIAHEHIESIVIDMAKLLPHKRQCALIKALVGLLE